MTTPDRHRPGSRSFLSPACRALRMNAQPPLRIGITGANGFVGKALATHLRQNRHQVCRLVRRHDGEADTKAIGDMGPEAHWDGALTGLDCVIHCAGRAHRLHKKRGRSEALYHRVNALGSLHLAQQARAQGVRRLVFISSIGVHGAATRPGRPFRHEDIPAPVNAYGASKLEGERLLQEFARASGLEVVVVRPPLIYGPGAPGNFQRLIRLIRTQRPLPLGGIRNRRSLMGIDNLCSLLEQCCQQPAAAGDIFLAADRETISTPSLIRLLARALQCRSTLLPVPANLLRLLGAVTGKASEVGSLVDHLEIDIDHTQRTLQWSPPCSLEQGLREAVSVLPD